MSTNWQPSASLHNLQLRAQALAKIRSFFTSRQVLEVDTPLLASSAVTDPHMPLLEANNPCGKPQAFYLQSSPEYAMKRLLAAGSGPIYQICKAFRGGESSPRHNPEFSLLEWYRPGFSLDDLMTEICELLEEVLDKKLQVERCSYRQLFLTILDIDPHVADAATLESLARRKLDIQMDSDDRDDWLHVLMAECIEPELKNKQAVFVYDYPASQAALARLSHDESGALVARRFELYVNGLELANGYDELLDADQLRQRFLKEREQRQCLGRPDIPIDEHLLAAMRAGMPACSGVALGLDRLLMIQAAAENISEVISFDVDRA